jgi:hypothetical protein
MLIMHLRKFLILLILITGCKTSSDINEIKTLSENNKDVFLLSKMVQTHFRNFGERSCSLNELRSYDTLGIILNNFEKIELKQHGGHISILYKFSNARDTSKIVINKIDAEIFNHLRWRFKKIKNQYNGEIRFFYGERFYNINKITIYR